MTEALTVSLSLRRRPGQEHYEIAVTRMVDSLPPGAIVFVHSHGALIAMRSLILRRRGEGFGARVIVAASEADEEPIRWGLRSSRVEFFRSPFLTESRAYTAAVSALLERAAAEPALQAP